MESAASSRELPGERAELRRTRLGESSDERRMARLRYSPDGRADYIGLCELARLDAGRVKETHSGSRPRERRRRGAKERVETRIATRIGTY